MKRLKWFYHQIFVLKRLSFKGNKHENNRLLYYANNYARLLIPKKIYRSRLDRVLATLNSMDDACKNEILTRANYYNKLEQKTNLSNDARLLSELSLKDELKVYFFDLYEYGRYFDQKLKWKYLFGDIREIPEEPTLVKSRPIAGNNINSVLLKWNKVRHYMFIKNDPKRFVDKKNMLVSRQEVGAHQENRVRFLEMYIDHPMCNIGMINDGLNPKWKKGRMSIDEQLEYKFILSLEGNDVATNLKWVMSSNSIAVTTKPKFETWFMEGTLIPDYHYILIKDDFSDLQEKLNYYIHHPEKAQDIIKNAHEYLEKFKDKKSEDLISLLVLKKYFQNTSEFSYPFRKKII